MGTSIAAAPQYNTKMAFRNLMEGHDLNALVKLGSALTLFQIFAMISRLPEMLTLLVGSSFYFIPSLTAMLLTLGLVTGVFGRLVSVKAAWFSILFLTWVAITLPFSGYRSGSLASWVEVMKLVPVLFFAGGFLSSSAKTVRRGVWAFVWAGLGVIVWCLVNGGGGESDRLQSEVGGSFANANEVAMITVFLIPFLAWVAANGRYKMVTRLAIGSMIPVAIFVTLRTGSRGGMLSLALIAAIVIFKAAPVKKIQMVVAAVIALAVLIPMIPEKTRARLGTVFNGDRASDVTDGTSSSLARRDLLLESIETTFRHPLIGVGLGVYADVVAGENAANGKTVHWQVAHNSYTEVSAETGLPGFVLWFTSVVYAFKHLIYARKVFRQKPELTEMYHIAGAVMLSLLLFMFNGFFTSMATSYTLYTLCGFSIAIYLFTTRLEKELASAPSSSGDVASLAGTARPLPRMFDSEAFQTHGFGPSIRPSLPPDGPSGTGAHTSVAEPKTKTAKKPAYPDAPWRRNPRKFPPPPGTPAR